MRRRKNNLTQWLIPVTLASILTAGFIYLIPIQDRGVAVTVTTPDKAAEQPPVRQQITQPAQTAHPPQSRAQAAEHTQEAASPEPQRGLYKWKDADGRTHYEEHPPLNVEAVAVDTAATNTSVVQMVTPATTSTRSGVTTPAPQNTYRPTCRKHLQKNTRCIWVKEQIRSIDARMRAGNQNGEYLRDRRRQLVNERSKVCH